MTVTEYIVEGAKTCLQGPPSSDKALMPLGHIPKDVVFSASVDNTWQEGNLSKIPI